MQKEKNGIYAIPTKTINQDLIKIMNSKHVYIYYHKDYNLPIKLSKTSMRLIDIL